jgi:hypothetical protein
MYDAILVVWRDKVLFNLVRPTTVVHAVKGEHLLNPTRDHFKVLRRSQAMTGSPTFAQCRMPSFLVDPPVSALHSPRLFRP